MKFPRTVKFIPALLIFMITGASVYVDFFEDPRLLKTPNIMDYLFYFAVRVLFWLTSAYLLNRFFDKFIWGGLIKIPAGKGKSRLPDFFSVFFYTVAIALIVADAIGIPLSSELLVIFLLILIFGLMLRPKFVSLFEHGFISSEKPFNIGDWIELIGKDDRLHVIGEITDIDRGSIRLKNEDNSLMIFPNNMLNEFVIKNYYGFNKENRFSVEYILSATIPIEIVKRILVAGTDHAMIKLGIKKKRETECYVSPVDVKTMKYEVFFWLAPWKNVSPAKAKDIISEYTWKHLEAAGIIAINSSVYNETLLSVEYKEGKKRLLKRVDLFTGLTSDEIDYLSQKVSVRRYNINEEIISAGAEGESMFVISEGFVSVNIKGKEDKNIVVSYLSPGSFFGEMSLLTGQKRSATIRTESEVICLELIKGVFQEILVRREDIINEIGRVIEKRESENIAMLADDKGKRDSFIHGFANKVKSFFGLSKISGNKKCE